MVDTNTVIESLARSVRPVRRLPSPGRRVVRWLAMGLPVIGLFGIIMGARPDLGTKLSEPAFVVPFVAAFATAVFAAHAAFASSVPGTPRWWLWLPAPPFALWVGSLGHQCWQDWLRLGADGIVFELDFACLPTIAIVGAVPAIAMVMMVRRSAPLMPRLTAFFGALAAAALAYVGLRLVHLEDAALMVLVWQFGAVALLATVSGAFGRGLFASRC
ncbi:conserved membrane hypothetical protein [uncultured Defluviicoccus sp.]|uniref:DUF1109 domain-containing protein n=1 Tax=metagenome TaxID=256318 RepID=A0A380TFC2_9ZZZZ|nr:conserved membrane hypothetical protein [uncultured Defluviicoccus sp.]